MIPPSHLEPCATKSERPPLFLRLTPSALQAMSDKRTLAVTISGGAATFMIGDNEYQGTLLPDPGAVELFVKNGEGYQSKGQISKRLVLSERKTIPPSGESHTISQRETTKDHTKDQAAKKPSPKHRPLVHESATGPITAAALNRKTSVPLEDCREFLLAFAYNVDENRTGASDPFVLHDETYLYVRPWEYSYGTDDDRQMAIDNCRVALDRLKVGPEHPARKGLRRPSKPAVRSSSAGAASTAGVAPTAAATATGTDSTTSRTKTALKTKTNGVLKKLKEPVKKRAKETSPPSITSEASVITPVSSGSTLTSSRSKRLSYTTPTSPPKRRKQDMGQMAHEFRSLYKEYSVLYASLASCSLDNRPQNELQRLLSMHNELASMKGAIWAAETS